MTSPEDQTSTPLPKLPTRPANSHKGNYGRALLVGGSTGMSGAIALAGSATLKSGAGLVTLAVPEAIQNVVATLNPCYMTQGLFDDSKGHLISASITSLSDAIRESADVWAIGPGLGNTEETAELVSQLYTEIEKPMVVDADGLNSLAHRPEALSSPGGPRVLTPHPGEFVRLALVVDPDWDEALAARSEDSLQRQHAASWLASHDQTGQTTVVLKGSGTVVADGSRAAVNSTGNPGMATGGTGDVLTGVVTGLLCQGFGSWDAARLAVHVHGKAGDLAADILGQVSMTASDLLNHLPAAFQSQSQ